MTVSRVQHPLFIKICGLTDPLTAFECTRAGAMAVGLVFFEKSPRYVSFDTGAAICSALPEETLKTGVFVDENFESIMATVQTCGLSAVQLHGQEPPELVTRLQQENLMVIKALFAAKAPFLSRVSEYDHANFLLIEYGTGILPGGNAESWDYHISKGIHTTAPVILAGGLNPENIAGVIQKVGPFGVDVSSGVESSPGVKDLDKIRGFIKNARAPGA
ncbi:MAG: phosphoribosylanthranilate isomerase [Desulfobacteraceae bacterium]|nr:MAG: phosphoribosylanthranilate isomerase [Desulfobacteraceae bacterium]